MCSMPSVAILLISTLIVSIKATASEHNVPSSEHISFSFNLHHEYRELNEFRYTSHVQMDLSVRQDEPTWTLQSQPTTVYRPSSQAGLQRARLRSLHQSETEKVEWEAVETVGPDIEDQHTLAQLARMTGNAYALPGQKNWYDIDSSWNNSFPFGWEDDQDGFRGHVFVSDDQAVVILAIKGTTLQGPTSKRDKFNDNLLFSCCCARVDLSWIFSTVCNCYTHHWSCDESCLSNALIQDSLFYSVGVDIVNNVTALYPSSDIWLVGHSLGGALASLLGSTFGLPSVAFESPGERLAATRLHIPLPPSVPGYPSSAPVPVTHVYHNADPIAQGTCTGISSPCTHAGYALETRCHLGKSIVYDTVGRFNWRVDIRHHSIREVITKVLEEEGEWENGRQVPMARMEDDCVDCYKWDFFENDVYHYREQSVL